MKTKFLLFTLFISAMNFAQYTAIPDANFENYLETHDSNGNSVAVGDPTSMGNGISNDNYVTTANINTVIILNVPNQNISDLTGIEDFSNLQNLEATGNNLTTVDISQNINLGQVSFNSNQLTSIDLSSNSNLHSFSCFHNQLTEIDLSLNSNLTQLYCVANSPLTNIKMNNGNNTNIISMSATNCPNLTCIIVDDASYSTANWTNIDPASTFVNNQAECNALEVIEIDFNNNLNIYPNPTKNEVNIQIDRKANYKIYNITGQIMKKGELINGENNLNFYNLNQGVYFIKIIDNHTEITKKLIIK